MNGWRCMMGVKGIWHVESRNLSGPGMQIGMHHLGEGGCMTPNPALLQGLGHSVP